MAAAVAASFTACSNDDYTNWADLITNPQGATVSFGNGSVTEVDAINFADYQEDGAMVQVCKMEAPTVSDPAYVLNHYELIVNGQDLGELKDCKTSAADLEKLFVKEYGKRPTQRILIAHIDAYFDNATKPLKFSSDNFAITGIPMAPVIEDVYYITGNVNEWNNKDTSLALVNGGGDVYDDPVFKVNIPATGSDIEFKVTPKSGLGGDWSSCLTATSVEGKFADQNQGGNFVIPNVADAVFYEVTFNMLEMTWSYKAVSFGPYLWAPGEANGWNHAAASRLSCPDGSGIYTGYIYAKGGFKFTDAANWDGTNYGWGSSASDLDPAGGNLWLSDEAAVYYVEVDLNTKICNYTKIENVSLIGDFNGWNGDVELTWDADNLCFTGDCSAVTSAGWKFRINHDWAINLGGDDCTNLWNNGPNLSVTGSTVKLYPTRMGADNIYCTVE